MEKDNNIRYIAIGNLVEREIVIEYAPKREKISKFQDATKMMIEKLILISITANERHTESMNEEYKFLNYVDRSVKWCFISKLLFNLAITQKDFPERIGYQMLTELESKSLNLLNTKFFNLRSNKEEIKTHSDNIQLNMVELYRKYKDPGNVDRLIDIKRDVDDMQRHMKENVKKMVSSIDDAKHLEQQSEKIKLMGEDFKKNAFDLSKVTRWANWKLTLAAGTLGGSFLGYLIYIFLK
jgi:hypothetical protein